MDPSRRVPSAPVSPTFEIFRDSEPPDEADNNGTPANNAPTSQPPLRSQAEFLMTGVLPVPDQPKRPCSICVENLTEDVVQMARCRHTFHTTCVLRWFQSRAERRGACPNCREELFDPALPASPEPSEYTSQYGSAQGLGGGVRIWPPSSPALPATHFPGMAGHYVGFLDQPSAQSGAEARTRTRAEIVASWLLVAERERDHLRLSQGLRLLNERGRDRLRRLQEFIESGGAPPASPTSGRHTLDSSLRMSDDIRAEGQAAQGLFLEPPCPSSGTTVAQNEHAREYARNLARARQHGMPAPSHGNQAARRPSRVNVGPPDRRQVIASMTTWRLEELVRDDSSTAEIRVLCEQELILRRAESNLYASPTAQVSQREHESARPPETTFGASSSYTNMRQTGILGLRSPRLTRDETFARADTQRREEREAEAARWQERLGRFRSEQAMTAAQDPSTLYSNPRMPAIRPQVPLSPRYQKGHKELEIAPPPMTLFEEFLHDTG
ncbi:hypothetical protein E8E11_004082 [Didymella keratinophila]|nr:hypothetical protein E8E11_004082 [Didymella keratinophila]